MALFLRLCLQQQDLLFRLSCGEAVKGGICRGQFRQLRFSGLKAFQRLSTAAVQLSDRQFAVKFSLLLQFLTLSGKQFQLSLRLFSANTGRFQITQRMLHTAQFVLQFRDQAVGTVGAAAVAPIFQGALGGRSRNVLLAGGGKGRHTAFQFRIGGDSHSILPHQSRPGKYVLADTQQHLTHIGSGQSGHRIAGCGIDRLKLLHGGSTGGGPANGDVTAIPIQLDLAGHGCAAPGLIAVFVGQIADLVPLFGVNAVEHCFQEGDPGGFSGFVGRGNDGQSIARGEGRMIQRTKGGDHFFDRYGHRSSPPSSAARPNRAASRTAGRSSSGAKSRRRRISRRNRPVRVSSSALAHKSSGRVVSSRSSA